MNRVLTARSQTGVFSAVQFGNQLPLALTGPAPALAMGGIQSFGLAGYDDVRAKAATAFAALYRGVDHPMATQASRTLKAVGTVDTMRATAYTPADGAVYPDGGLGSTLEDLARIIKAKVGLSLATIDIGGWDMHTNEGRVDGGDLRNHLVELDDALDAFAADLGDGFGDVTVVVLSEFGRTVRENGTVGTDHGHGQRVWVLGGGVNGGRVYGSGRASPTPRCSPTAASPRRRTTATCSATSSLPAAASRRSPRSSPTTSRPRSGSSSPGPDSTRRCDEARTAGAVQPPPSAPCPPPRPRRRPGRSRPGGSGSGHARPAAPRRRRTSAVVRHRSTIRVGDRVDRARAGRANAPGRRP